MPAVRAYLAESCGWKTSTFVLDDGAPRAVAADAPRRSHARKEMDDVARVSCGRGDTGPGRWERGLWRAGRAVVRGRQTGGRRDARGAGCLAGPREGTGC